MKIVALVKQVPDTAQLSATVDGLKISGEGGPRIVNPWDEHALETAFQLREAHGGSAIALCAGKPEAVEALKTALAMGADDAFLLTDSAFEGGDSLATARVLAAAVQKIGGVDLIVAGRSSIDANHAATAVQVAALLDLPQISYVADFTSVDPRAGTMEAVRLLESGRETVRSRLPAVITVVKEINEPRYPTFIGIRKAAAAEVPQWTIADLGLEPGRVGSSGSQVRESDVRLSPSSQTELGILQGAPEEAARSLVERLAAEGVL